jgi:hypothetical protein
MVPLEDGTVLYGTEFHRGELSRSESSRTVTLAVPRLLGTDT